MLRLLVVFIASMFWNQCAGLNFCEQAATSTVVMAPIQTVSYPSQQIKTNPACSCRFSIDNVAEGRLEVSADCPNSGVTFRVYGETKLATPENKETRSVRCDNFTAPNGVVLINAASIYRAVTVSVDADQSDAYSSFQVYAFVVNLDSEYSLTTLINTTCQAPKSALLSSKEQTIIASSVAGTATVIALIVVIYCVWRNRSRLRKRTFAPKQIEEQQCQDDFTDKNENPEPSEKPPRSAVKYTQSQPRSKLVHITKQIESKPENKDLVEFAKSLHEKRKLERWDSLRLPTSAV